MIKLPRLLAGAVTLLLCCHVVADESLKSVYNPLETFAPLTLPDPVNRYRSGNGAPGPDYWQNRVDYSIHANLDPARKQLSADEAITYTNNSPDALDSLWLQLDQNIYRKDSRAARSGPSRAKAFTNGYQLDSVEVLRGHPHKAKYIVNDTRMQIRLERPLRSGEKMRFRIRYHYEIPGKFGGRNGWTETKNGDIYDIAQWFPRLCVYDDLRGWNTLPYVGSEFYLEYGTIDYFVTVPWNMLVAGSGVLQNPRQVLTRVERSRLKLASMSDKTLMIRSAAEVTDPSSRPKQAGTLTWHFRLDNTRDVAFSASSAFIWDAARANLPDGKTVLAQSFYPEESSGNAAWSRSTEYLKNAVENFSRHWADYPYPIATNVAGPVSGMEYPSIVFDGIKDKGKGLFWLTAHEIGHTWFPMMVGSNERRNAFMDEGFNTFMDVYESDEFENGVYGPKHDHEYAPGGKNPVEDIQDLMEDPAAPAIMNRPDVIGRKYGHPVSYFKTALGLVLLREQILGPERFDFAFRKYIRDWSFRHPSPSDFFRAMNSGAGEDLSWFWRGWFMKTWQLDLAVTGVSYVDNNPAKGATIDLMNLKKQVMPVELKVNFADGSSERLRVPVETWMHGATARIPVYSTQPVQSVVLDPDVKIPDADRSNNQWQAPVTAGK